MKEKPLKFEKLIDVRYSKEGNGIIEVKIEKTTEGKPGCTSRWKSIKPLSSYTSDELLDEIRKRNDVLIIGYWTVDCLLENIDQYLEDEGSATVRQLSDPDNIKAFFSNATKDCYAIEVACDMDNLFDQYRCFLVEQKLIEA